MAQDKFIVNKSWQAVAKVFGIAPEDILRHAGLATDLMHKDRFALSVPDYFQFWQTIEHLSADPDFCIKVVTNYTPELFNPSLFAALCSPNYLVAMDRLRLYKPLVYPLTLGVDVTHDALSITCMTKVQGLDIPLSMNTIEVCFLTNLARIGTRETITPLSVSLPYAPKNQAAIEDFLNCTLSLDGTCRIHFSRLDAERPFMTANDALWQVFEPDLRKRLKDLDGSANFKERVRAVLTEGLPAGQISKEGVAKKLAVSTRTLQRRLKKEETSFQSELNLVRENLAQHYLKNTSHSSAEIAFLLGYEDPTSFHRAFQNWTGQTPNTVRLLS